MAKQLSPRQRYAPLLPSGVSISQCSILSFEFKNEYDAIKAHYDLLNVRPEYYVFDRIRNFVRVVTTEPETVRDLLRYGKEVKM